MKQLRAADWLPTAEEIELAALQFVRKVSGYRQLLRTNEVALPTAVADIDAITCRLLDSLVDRATWRGSSGPGMRRQFRDGDDCPGKGCSGGGWRERDYWRGCGRECDVGEGEGVDLDKKIIDHPQNKSLKSDAAICFCRQPGFRMRGREGGTAVVCSPALPCNPPGKSPNHLSHQTNRGLTSIN
jgi:hypothetical protein